MLIGADTNGQSFRWHSRDENARGRHFVDVIDGFGLTVANRHGEMDTYYRDGMGSSNIDVTIADQQTVDRIKDWKVCDATDSDHRVLEFRIDTSSEDSIAVGFSKSLAV